MRKKLKMERKLKFFEEEAKDGEVAENEEEEDRNGVGGGRKGGGAGRKGGEVAEGEQETREMAAVELINEKRQDERRGVRGPPKAKFSAHCTMTIYKTKKTLSTLMRLSRKSWRSMSASVN